jgi:DNA-binding MarR family transcriptional regulator
VTLPGAAIEAAHLIDRLDRLARSGGAPGALNSAQWEALRFLSRANRFSRTPAALAEYLGSTRGTVSQTLIALELKGFIERRRSARDGRSIDLALTRQGRKAIEGDPILDLAETIAAIGPEARILAEMLRTTVHALIARNGGRAFGACHTCRHFRRNVGNASKPHHCALLAEALSDSDSHAICAEQEREVA